MREPGFVLSAILAIASVMSVGCNDDNSTTSCEESALRCYGNNLEICHSNKYELKEACTNGCESTACKTGETCIENALRCNGNNLEICHSNKYELKEACTNGCESNACKVSTCEENALRCNGKKLEICHSNKYELKENCVNGCTNEACSKYKQCKKTSDCDTTYIEFTNLVGENQLIYNEHCIGGQCIKTCLIGADIKKDCTGEGEVCALSGLLHVIGVGVCTVPRHCSSAADCDVFAKESCIEGFCAVSEGACDDTGDGAGVNPVDFGVDCRSMEACMNGGDVFMPSLKEYPADWNEDIWNSDWERLCKKYFDYVTVDWWEDYCDSIYDSDKELQKALPEGCVYH